MSKFINHSIDEMICFNPPESIKKGIVSKKIPMEKLTTFTREIAGYENAAYSSGPKFRNGDTLLAKITPCLENGKTALVDLLNDNEVAFGSTEFIVLRSIKETTDSRFVYYFARSPAFREKAIKCMEGTSGRKRVNDSVLKKQKLPFPDIKEQKSIAAVLSALDDKIALNNKINKELEAMAKTLYDYWFVQFDFPNEKGKPYKSSGGKMVYNRELKRNIPADWQVKAFNDYIHEGKGGDWGKEKVQGNYTEEVYCIRGTDFPSLVKDGFCLAPLRFILPKNSFKKLNSGDLIIEISGGSPIQSTGRICYINEGVLKRFDNAIIASNFCKTISLKNIEALYFIYLYWDNLYSNGLFFNYEGKTTGIKNLLFENFVSSYKTPIIPDKILSAFNTQISPVFNKIQQNFLESAHLASLRDFLLPMLMNGQVIINHKGEEGAQRKRK